MILKDKTAIVTGGAGGIGRAIVSCFAEHGANVWACDLDESEEFNSFCESESNRNGVFVSPMYFDICSGGDDFIKRIRDTKKPIDILVNNAGVDGGNNGFQMVKIEDLERIMQINLRLLA